MIDTNDVRLLTERQVGRQLNVSDSAVRRWRRTGEGPPWIRVGKRLVRYDLAELRKWIAECAGVHNGR